MIPLLVTLTVVVGVGRFFAHRQRARQRLALAELPKELLPISGDGAPDSENESAGGPRGGRSVESRLLDKEELP